VTNPRFWTHEYIICGIAGLIVWVIASCLLRELSPALRDQLMVTMRDRALIEAKAKGMSEEDIGAALAHPFRVQCTRQLVGRRLGLLPGAGPAPLSMSTSPATAGYGAAVRSYPDAPTRGAAAPSPSSLCGR
jgi:hypothetical protein